MGQVEENRAIQSYLTGISYTRDRPRIHDELLPKATFITFLHYITDSVITRSIFSTLVRSEAFMITDTGSKAILNQTVQKELSATQNCFSTDKLVDYSSMFGDIQGPWSSTSLNTPQWKNKAFRIAERIVTGVRRMSRKMIFPSVQRKKNMSRETCKNLMDAGFPPIRQWISRFPLQILEPMKTKQ